MHNAINQLTETEREAVRKFYRLVSASRIKKNYVRGDKTYYVRIGSKRWEREEIKRKQLLAKRKRQSPELFEEETNVSTTC